MNLMKGMTAWTAAFAVFLVLDLLWLGVVARDFYRLRMNAVVDMQVNLPVAFLFYVIHVIGVMVFVVTPAVQAQSPLLMVLARGALYGFFTYATYDLTNLATVNHWPVGLAVTDMAWGTVLNSVVALAGFEVLRRL